MDILKRLTMNWSESKKDKVLVTLCVVLGIIALALSIYMKVANNVLPIIIFEVGEGGRMNVTQLAGLAALIIAVTIGLITGQILQTYKTCLEALEHQTVDEADQLSCDRNICTLNEYNGIGCAECICATGSGACQKDDQEEVMPVENVPCEERVSIGELEQVMWERDVAISQLNDLGYGLGQKMWISVNDFLPPERENHITMDFYEYPVTFRSGDVRDVRYYKYGNGHWWHGSGIMDEYVTAWMPRPKPYEEE